MSDIDKYDYVRFSVGDIHGRSRGRVIPARHVKRFLETGITLYGGFLSFDLKNEDVPISIDDPDSKRIPKAFAVADLSTLYAVPWASENGVKVADVICESYWLKDRTKQLACPRYVATQQLQKLADHGFSFFSGFELEFLLMKPGQKSSRRCDLMNQRLVTKHSDFLFDLEKQMYLAGVDIENIHAEFEASTFEAVLRPSYGITSAESCFKFKTGILEIADKKDRMVSFQSKHSEGEIGMHFNHSLWSVTEGINVFHDPGSRNGLSPLGHHWLAGILKHSKALTALWCPTSNCFDRLHKPNLPGLIFWSTDDRAACVKLKSSETGTYLEHRIPSGMSNPYITLAATIAAGLDGIVKKLECPPVDEFSTPNALPHTLSEAIDDLETDADMVHSLGEEFVEWFVRTLKSDINPFNLKNGYN
ncbi:lengsin-like [Haliotis cracherodii]|uniref:lengsin-like n=1 Tax=Haliotis cracherodii TaxID=6455 RepID=UPI0039EBE978